MQLVHARDLADWLLDAAERATRIPGGFGGGPAPRSVRAAAGAAPDATLVLISVPGPAVLGEAMDAVAAGRHVMVFSDNVPVEHEIVPKKAAAEAGVLVMGPDCGTAMVGGIGLGFANVLDSAIPGPAVGVAAGATAARVGDALGGHVIRGPDVGFAVHVASIVRVDGVCDSEIDEFEPPLHEQEVCGFEVRVHNVLLVD